MCVAGSIFPCAPNDSRNEASQWPKTALTPLSGFDSRNARLGLTTFFLHNSKRFIWCHTHASIGDLVAGKSRGFPLIVRVNKTSVISQTNVNTTLEIWETEFEQYSWHTECTNLSVILREYFSILMSPKWDGKFVLNGSQNKNKHSRTTV